MSGDDPALAAAVEHRMDGDDLAVLEDTDLGGGAVHFDQAAARAIGHAVEIAADRDHAVAGDAPLEPQDALERARQQRLQCRALLGEMLGDDTLGGGVDTGVGDLVEPLAELIVEILKVAKAAAEEKALLDV